MKPINDKCGEFSQTRNQQQLGLDSRAIEERDNKGWDMDREMYTAITGL